ncbi:YibE/F family protein [Clostridium sp. 19966]|uniref:YibE/F family protein n=1 Tax=Clostridium sp. 19966 TaxID=2768166 RepID=UPI0028EB349E|nr:YibE/F family protein [Clostridium sp. 19966]
MLETMKRVLDSKFKRNAFMLIIAIVFTIISIYFVNNNEKYYNKTVAKVTSVQDKTSQTTDTSGNTDETINQQVTAVVLNGSHKGEKVTFENNTTFSNAKGIYLKENDKVFISIYKNSKDNSTAVGLLDFKRDNYLYYMVILFVLFVLLIGRIKGFRALVSLTINIFLILAVVTLYLSGWNLLLTSSLASILFIVLSIFLVSGINKKSYAAIIGTIAGTVASMLIAYIVIKFTNGQGIHYEGMEFLTHLPEQIFFPEILIGTLGAIMDISISMASSIKEIYDTNPDIERKALIKSAMEIGKDIIGTMANTLVFAYISGSMPMLLILLKNSFPISEMISLNLGLEIIRALTGSIGIVLSIPITMFISIVFIKRAKIGEK